MSGNIHRPHRKGRQLHPNESQPRLARRTEEPADAGIEESLREAEQRFRTIFDNTSDGILVHDLETQKLTMCNKSCSQMLGYNEEEFVQLSVADIHPEADLPFIHAQIEKFLKGDKPIRCDIRFKRKDGSILFADVSPDLVLLDGRRYVLVALKDITARKRAEESLAESERKYRSLVENIPDVTWTTDRQGHTLFISANVREVYGYSANEVCAAGSAWLENIHPDDRGRIERAFDELFTHRKRYDVEYRIRRKDETWIWLHDRSVSTYEKDGQWYADGIFSDITERKRMEEELQRHTEHLEELVAARTGDLRESEHRYRRLVENLKGSHFVYRHDTMGVFTYVSESVTQVLGYTTDEGMPHYGKYFTDHPANQAAHQHTELTLQGIRQSSYEVNVWHKDGSARWLEVQEVPVYDADGKVVAVEGVAQDITERKRAEEALLESEERYRILLEHGFDGIFVHENFQIVQVNDRLAEMSGYTRSELLGSKAVNLFPPGSQERIRQYIHSETGGCYEIQLRRRDGQVRQMLRDAIERSRNLSYELSPAIYQVELMEILEWLARHMQERHGLTVHVETHGRVDSPSEPLKAFLYKVAQELLFNVVKHAGVREATVRVRRMRQWICLSVVDQGRGFDPRELEGAAGFGLLGIRERVQLLGGRMKIWSMPGMGSRILIAVPDQGASGAAVP